MALAKQRMPLLTPRLIDPSTEEKQIKSRSYSAAANKRFHFLPYLNLLH